MVLKKLIDASFKPESQQQTVRVLDLDEEEHPTPESLNNEEKLSSIPNRYAFDGRFDLKN